MTTTQLQHLHDRIVQDLAPFLVCAPPPLSFSNGKYICLKLHTRHFIGQQAPDMFRDTFDAGICHIHLGDALDDELDTDSRDVNILIRTAGPALRQALQPLLFTLRLEGAL